MDEPRAILRDDSRWCENPSMTNIAVVLKTEIARIARKEVRGEVSPVKKASSQHRSAIAALRREIDAVKRQLKAATKGTANHERVEAEAAARHRFQARGLVTHRKKLGLSASAYGQLVGVSGQTIYKWEDGKAHPRARQLEALAAIRGLGKREAAARLEQVSQNAKPAGKSTAAGRPGRGRKRAA